MDMKAVCAAFPNGDTFFFKADNDPSFLTDLTIWWLGENKDYADSHYAVGASSLVMPQKTFNALPVVLDGPRGEVRASTGTSYVQ